MEKPFTIEEIEEYENGRMGEAEEIVFFQKLIDNGWAWRLQGHYGRVATHLMRIGACHQAGSTTPKPSKTDEEGSTP